MVAFFLSDTCKTVGGLTTTAVLLRQLDRDFLQDGANIALKRGEDSAITVDNDEAEFLVIFEQVVEAR